MPSLPGSREKEARGARQRPRGSAITVHVTSSRDHPRQPVGASAEDGALLEPVAPSSLPPGQHRASRWKSCHHWNTTRSASRASTSCDSRWFQRVADELAASGSPAGRGGSSLCSKPSPKVMRMNVRMEWYNDHRGSAGFGSHSPRRRKNRSPPFPLVRPDVSLRFSTACGFSLTKPFTGPSLSYFEGFDRGAHRAWRRILPCDHSR
jgi:hypothetical protein